MARGMVRSWCIPCHPTLTQVQSSHALSARCIILEAGPYSGRESAPVAGWGAASWVLDPEPAALSGAGGWAGRWRLM